MKASDNLFPSVLFNEQGSTPTTPSTGNWRLFTRSDGLYIVDDTGSVTGPFISNTSNGYTEGARVYNDANISVPAGGSGTTLTFNQEIYDTDTIHSTTSNTSRLTCNTAGKYMICANVQWPAGGTGIRDIWITKNGSTIIAINTIVAISATNPYNSLTTIIDLEVNDYVELVAYQTSSGAVNCEAVANYVPSFMMQRIG